MKYTLTIILGLTLSVAFCQSETGIFLTTPCAKQSKKETVMITNKVICLAPNPIIFPTEFTAVTDVSSQGDKISFDLTISQKAMQTLSKISTNLPTSTFALVVEKEVFYTFPANDLTVNRTFRFQATGKDLPLFNTIQRRLKSAITPN
jgi:hypothetical protein